MAMNILYIVDDKASIYFILCCLNMWKIKARVKLFYIYMENNWVLW